MDTVIVKQVKSAISSNKSQRATLRSLGLRKISSEVKHNATPQILAQVKKVSHLVEFEIIKVVLPKKRAPKKAATSKTASKKVSSKSS